MTATTDSLSALIVQFPVHRDFDPELTKRDVARLWRCSTKTIERHVDPTHAGARGLRPLPWFTTHLGRRRSRLSEVEAGAPVASATALGRPTPVPGRALLAITVALVAVIWAVSASTATSVP